MDYMARALSLAHQAVGATSPNPPVGAVVVKEGQIAGEGHTLPPGQNHAEVVALQKAGQRARNAILYVTLEPCCFYGRTPPCTNAIIEAGINEVHIATRDPNPKVNGKGKAELEAAGINVSLEETEEQTRALYEAYTKHVTVGMPFVIAKFAMTLDGKIATHTGDSQWVTGPTARRRVQQLRSKCDAIMVGINTVLHDDPKLTARDGDDHPLSRQPLRVVVDSHARTPLTARLLGELGDALIAVAGADQARVAALNDTGAQVLSLPEPTNERVDLPSLLATLGQRGIVRLLIEGGGTLLGSLFDQNLIDKVFAFIAPRIVGGQKAPSPVEGRGISTLAEAISLQRVTMESMGEDFLVIGYPSGR